MRALVIAHDPYGPACRVEERLVQRGFEVDAHIVTQDPSRPNDAAAFPSLDSYDVLVPMGSVHSLTRKHEIDSWIYDELDLIRQAHEGPQAVLGICFGGQLLAEALGGSVEEAPVPEIGWLKITNINGSQNPVGPGPWMQWHHDRFSPPPGAELLASNATSSQLFRIGRSVGTQFHPEVDVAHIAGFLAEATDEYLAGVGVDRAQLLADSAIHEAANIKQCHALVDWFLDEVAALG